MANIAISAKSQFSRKSFIALKVSILLSAVAKGSIFKLIIAHITFCVFWTSLDSFSRITLGANFWIVKFVKSTRFTQLLYIICHVILLVNSSFWLFSSSNGNKTWKYWSVINYNTLEGVIKEFQGFKVNLFVPTYHLAKFQSHSELPEISTFSDFQASPLLTRPGYFAKAHSWCKLV